MIETPYLLFLGDAPDPLAAKVAQGIRDWRPENCVGQLRLDGCKADLGLPDMDLAAAKDAGAKTLVIGVANRGGKISQVWKKVLVEALEEGRIKPGSQLLLAAFGAGLTRGAGLVHWGQRTTPLRKSDAELPPCHQTALEILDEAIRHTR